MNRLLRAYQVMATIVGINLIFVMTPFLVKLFYKYNDLDKYENPESWWNAYSGTIMVIDQVHGFLYMALLILVFLLTRRYQWSIGFMLTTMLLATIPLVSFFAERRASKRVVKDEAALNTMEIGAAETD